MAGLVPAIHAETLRPLLRGVDAWHKAGMTRSLPVGRLMYDIKWIRENADIFDDGRARRGLEPLSAQLLALDDARRAAIGELQAAQERRNAASKEIGAAMKAGDAARAEALKAEVAEIKENWPALEEAERYAIAELDDALVEHSQHAARRRARRQGRA